MIRAGFFIDGFNLYHAIDDLDRPHLKWCNYWRLAELLKDKKEVLSCVVTATAYYPDFNKKIRHERHVNALQNVGVHVLLGHYVKDDMDCRDCGHTWKKPTEKEGDINIALSLIDAAYNDLIDHAYLVTADTDHVATLRLFKKRFPNKKATIVAPPGRPHSQHLLGYALKRTITEDHIDLACFPHIVTAEGKKAVTRPREYDPPAGWVHPNDRPQKGKNANPEVTPDGTPLKPTSD